MTKCVILVTKCCHFVTKLWQNQGSAGWKLCGGGGSQKTIPVTDTSKFKKEKNIKNYFYYNNYTTILSGERYLAKNAKKQVRFLHTKHSTKYLCLKKLKKKSLKMSMKTEEITRVPQKKICFSPSSSLNTSFFWKIIKRIYNSSYVAISIS